ncbi:MAG: hypothetical protein QXZ66_01620 [Thermoproteota archaeon]
MRGANSFRFKLEKETGGESFQLGGEVSPGTYLTKLRVRIRDEVRVFQYPVKVETQASKIKMPIDVCSGIKDLNPYLVDVELVDYRLAFPVGFIIGGKKITADVSTGEMKLEEKKVMLRIKKVSHHGKTLHVWTEVRSSIGMQAHEPLVLVFSNQGGVGIGLAGEMIHPVREIEWLNDYTLKVTYSVRGTTQEGFFSFKSIPLEVEEGSTEPSVLKGGSWEKEVSIPLRKEDEKGEVKKRVSLASFLFTELGWRAYEQLKKKIKGKYALIAEFNNGETKICMTDALSIPVPAEASRITKVRIISRKD